MTRKAPLRAVTDGEQPEKPAKALNVRGAADSGDRRALLVSLRARIATDIDNPNTPARDLAALSRRLLEIAKEIEAIDATDHEDEVSAATDVPDEEWAVT